MQFRRRWTSGGIVALFGIFAGLICSSFSLALLGLIVGLLIAMGLIAYELYRLVNIEIPKQNFGICPGRTQKSAQGQALTDWIADGIDTIAGNLDANGKLGAPLTIGQLKEHKIVVAAMTTDLSSGRPYQLPLMAKTHYFSKREFEALFPERVVNYLVTMGTHLATSRKDLPDDLYQLPVGDDFPVLLVARMSLSFPTLIQAVPLYRYDDELKRLPHSSSKNTDFRIQKCIFSDGGISSNFPIHFFDAFLPSRPTLGITLADYDEARHHDVRIHLPKNARSKSTALAVRPIRGVLGFLYSILNTAKDWQDTLQTKLPGYAERIVEIRLTKDEGGLNLDMSPETIKGLTQLGAEAGQKLVDDFNFDEHRWRRALSFMAQLETELVVMSKTYNQTGSETSEADPTYANILSCYAPNSYKNLDDKWRANVLMPFVDNLAALGKTADGAEDTERVARTSGIPLVDGSIRLTADADRVPRNSMN